MHNPLPTLIFLRRNKFGRHDVPIYLPIQTESVRIFHSACKTTVIVFQFNFFQTALENCPLVRYASKAEAINRIKRRPMGVATSLSDVSSRSPSALSGSTSAKERYFLST